MLLINSSQPFLFQDVFRIERCPFLGELGEARFLELDILICQDMPCVFRVVARGTEIIHHILYGVRMAVAHLKVPISRASDLQIGTRVYSGMFGVLTCRLGL